MTIGEPVRGRAATITKPSRGTDELLEAVRLIWADVLDQDDPAGVPLEVNFFEAGGDSLLFIVLLERLNRLAGHEFEAAELFTHGSVREQAALLRSVPDEG